MIIYAGKLFLEVNSQSQGSLISKGNYLMKNCTLGLMSQWLMAEGCCFIHVSPVPIKNRAMSATLSRTTDHGLRKGQVPEIILPRNGAVQSKKAFLSECLFGDPGGIRTHDPPLRRRLLYPAELLSHNVGRGSRTRTGDPLLPKQVRYQLRYAP